MQPQRFDGTNNTQVRTVVGGDIGSSAGQPVSVGVPLSNLRHTQERSSVASPLTVSNIGGSSYLKKLMVVNPYRTRIQQHIPEPFVYEDTSLATSYCGRKSKNRLHEDSSM